MVAVVGFYFLWLAGQYGFAEWRRAGVRHMTAQETRSVGGVIQILFLVLLGLLNTSYNNYNRANTVRTHIRTPQYASTLLNS